MIEIFSPDTFRKSVESASSGQATILYDAYGNPNFMSVITKKTLGDLYPATWITEHGGSAGDTHPAFIVQDATGGATSEVDQIFISQYHNTIQNNCGVSMPNQIPYHGDRTDFETYTDNKGSGWHIMNSLEYGLLWGMAMEADINIKGNTSAVFSDTTEQFNYSADIAAKCSLFEIETDTLSCVTDMTAGELVTFSAGGMGELVNTYQLPTNLNTVTTGYMIVVQADVGSKIEESTSFTGLISLKTGSIEQVRMHETLGAGPVSWTHNNSPWGVWMHGAGREYIDSCIVGPDNGFTVLECVRNNYREHADRDLETLSIKICNYISTIAGLGYQGLHAAGYPIDDGNTEDDLNHAFYSLDMTGFLISTLATTNSDESDFLLLKEMGLYPISSDVPPNDYRNIWADKENIRFTGDYFITMKPDSLGRMYLCKGGWQSSVAQSTSEKTMHSFSFSSAEASSTYYDRKCLRFRTVYIPEI